MFIATVNGPIKIHSHNNINLSLKYLADCLSFKEEAIWIEINALVNVVGEVLIITAEIPFKQSILVGAKSYFGIKSIYSYPRFCNNNIEIYCVFVMLLGSLTGSVLSPVQHISL